MALNFFFRGRGGGGVGDPSFTIEEAAVSRQAINFLQFPASCPEQYFTFSWAACEADWFD